MATTDPTDDCMTPANMLDTIRGLVKEAHAEPDGTKAAVKAMAVVHLFHIMDILLVAGHELPEAWKVNRNDS